MKKIMTAAGAALALALAAAPAVVHAQAAQTWVSGVGDDVNPCSRTAPCKTFAGAISKTSAGGEINVLDPGGFGTVTITKSITIGIDPALGSILNAGTNGININAGVNDTITLRGLVIQAPYSGSVGVAGVRVLNAGTVNIENLHIYGDRAAAPNGIGIQVVNNANTVKVNVINTVVTDNGNATAGGGIVVAPTGSGSAVVTLVGVTASNNSRGIRLDSSGTTGSVKGALSNSAVTNNTLAGISVVSTGTPAALVVTNTVSSNNAGGLNANGSAAVATINRSSFFGNGVGLQAVNSGVIQSYNNNSNNYNTVDGAASSTLLLQ